MPSVNNKGIRIHYQVAGKGPPLVLQHGGGGSLEDWYDFGYVQGLRDDYQLILIDARGHGASDKPHDPEAYQLELRVMDIVMVLDTLGVHTTHYLGYSMGGWIAFGNAHYAPARFRSLIIGGAQPYGQNFAVLRQVINQGMEAFVARVEGEIGHPISPQWKARWLANDVDAFSALVQDRPDMKEILPTMTMPCLVYAGEADSTAPYQLAKECASHMPRAVFLSLPSLNHVQAYADSERVLPHVSRFLTEIHQA